MTRSQPEAWKVVLVEDEVVAREGIRDNVNWAACGFVFAGEASDGEAALPLIEEVRPDVVITDIRMPFMDGLHLAREVRLRFPSTRVLILSGYDDFSFAQTAIHLGIVEYLLKPISARDLERALLRMKVLLDAERARSRDQDELRRQADQGVELRREGLLLRICLGDVDPDELREIEPALGISPRCGQWIVLVARLVTAAPAEPRRLRELQALLMQSARSAPAAQSFKKDIEEVVVLVGGADEREVLERAARLQETLTGVLPSEADLWVETGLGAPRRELNEVPFSFAEALQQLDRQVVFPARGAFTAMAASGPGSATDAAPEFRRPIDRRALDRFLHHGSLGDFEAFYSSYAGPPAANDSAAAHKQAAASLHLLYSWLLFDVTLAAASFVAELGGEVTTVLPEATRADALWENIQNDEDLRVLVRSIVGRALEYRDQVARSSHGRLVRRVRTWIEEEFADPELSLQKAAAEANLSPSHFSVVFGRETGETFKGCLTRVRMEHARVLLRTTPLAVTEVARRCGYPDPSYFSSAFKRVCGVSPRDFREAQSS